MAIFNVQTTPILWLLSTFRSPFYGHFQGSDLLILWPSSVHRPPHSMAIFNEQITPILWPFSVHRPPHSIAIFSEQIPHLWPFSMSRSPPFYGHFQCPDHPILWPFSMHRSPPFYDHFQCTDHLNLWPFSMSRSVWSCGSSSRRKKNRKRKRRHVKCVVGQTGRIAFFSVMDVTWGKFGFETGIQFSLPNLESLNCSVLLQVECLRDYIINFAES